MLSFARLLRCALACGTAVIRGGWLLALRGTVLVVGPRFAALVRDAGEELVDQALEHEGRLGELDRAAVLQVRLRAARPDADVFAPEQSLGLDARVAVVRNLRVELIDAQA